MKKILEMKRAILKTDCNYARCLKYKDKGLIKHKDKIFDNNEDVIWLQWLTNKEKGVVKQKKK